MHVIFVLTSAAVRCVHEVYASRYAVRAVHEIH